MINEPMAFELTGVCKDKGHAPIVCEMCGKQSRFALLAKNRKPGSHWIVSLGPDCAGKVYNPAATAAGVSSEKWIANNKTALMNKAKHDRLVAIILHLKKQDQNTELNYGSLLHAVSRPKPELTPRQAAFIISRCTKHELKIDGDIIPVRLNSASAKKQITEMSEKMWGDIEPCMTKGQQTLGVSLRHRSSHDDD